MAPPLQRLFLCVLPLLRAPRRPNGHCPGRIQGPKPGFPIPQLFSSFSSRVGSPKELNLGEEERSLGVSGGGLGDQKSKYESRDEPVTRVPVPSLVSTRGFQSSNGGCRKGLQAVQNARGIRHLRYGGREEGEVARMPASGPYFWWCGPEDHLPQEKWEPRKRLSPCGQTWRSENPMHCHPKLYLKKQYTQEENGRAFCNFLFAETDTCFQPGFSSQTETPRRAPKFAELGFPS